MSTEPNIGNIYTTNDGRQLIFTGLQFGYIPNDEKTMEKIWNGYYCSNGMNECMSRSVFLKWWVVTHMTVAYEKWLIG